MRKQFLVCAAFLCLMFVFPMLATAQTLEDFIAQGDSAYKIFNNQTALKFYEKALQLDTRNYEVLWRVSRAYLDIGEHLPQDQQLAFFEKALIIADSTIAVNPNGTEGYLRRAIANGKISLFKGVWKSVGLVKKVKADCEKAIELDPQNDVAYYVLARAHQKVAEKSKFFRVPLGLGWGSKKKAKKLYEKAIALHPDFIMFNLDYARLLVDMGKTEVAKQILQKIPSMPIEDEDDQQYKKEAKELLKELEAR